ncbi:MAG: LamG-like jellyroll fold domain-containing protein [Candidatus Dojkabacteria bacterium]
MHANGGASGAATYRGGGGGGGRMIVYCIASSTYSGTANVTGGIVPGAQNGGVGSILGPTCKPSAPTTLTQYKLDNTTNIPLNGITTENGVVLGSNLSDPDSSDLLSLQVEVKPLGTAFTNVANYTQSSALSNPQNCSSPLSDCGKVTATALTLSREYHWQARVRDNHGGYSTWVSFGSGNAESARDFLISGPGRNITQGTGNSQTGTVFTDLSSPFTVTITDVNGFPVPNYGVSWSIVNAQNGGTLGASVTYTNESGVATNTYKLGRTVGNNSIQASGSGLVGSPIQFNFTSTPDVLHHFTVVAPQVALTSVDFDTVTVKAYDQYNNLKVDYSGTPTLSAVQALSTSNPGAGNLSPTTITFTGGDLGVKILSNVSYDTHESIKLKLTDGSSEGFSSTVAVVDTVGACPDADGIIDSNQSWNASESNLGIFDCNGLDIHITSGAILTLASYDNGDGDWTNDYGVTIITDNILVDSGSTINADSSGYATARGPGAAGGSAHGGLGGGGGTAYDSVYEPSQMGSGSSGPLAAGGAIKLTVSGLTQIEGTITANGAGGSGCHQGGASGGSIWINTNVLKGAGVFRTNGGNGVCNAGGGAGGRIAIYYTTNGDGLGGGNPFALTSQTNIQSHGGPGDWCGLACNAGAGTIYVEHKGVDISHQGRLYVDNANSVASAAVLPQSDYVFSEIKLTRYGNLTILGDSSTLSISDGTALTGDSTKPNLTVEGTFLAPQVLNINGVDVGVKGEINLGGNNGTSTLTIGDISAAGLTLYAYTWAHTNGSYTFGDVTVGGNGSIKMVGYDNGDGDYTNDFGIDFYAANLLVQTGGTINSDQLGFGTDRGRGTANGASYGGIGGYASGSAYGSVYEPHELGSGGSGGGVYPAGGSIKLIIAGTAEINGNLSSNGGSGYGCHAGGASGGSVWVETGTLKGSGVISSNGGNGICAGSGASGGRIALYYGTNGDGLGGDNTFALADRTHVQAFGGAGSWYGPPYNGGAGTVYVEQRGVDDLHAGRLYVDNANSTAYTATLIPGNYLFKEVNLQRSGNLEILGDDSILTITDGNDLTGDATKPNLNIYGTLVGPSVLNVEGVSLSIYGEITLGSDNSMSSITIGNTLESSLLLSANTWAHTNGDYTFGEINVGFKGVVNLKSYDNGDSDWTNDYGVNLIADNLTIDLGGRVSADIQGYAVNRGPGTGNGAGYGGYGGYGSAPYGSVYVPALLGSGGTSQSGGGAIKLTISGLISLNGTISSDGGNGIGCHNGGSSGGSVWIDTQNINGTGTITSNGGSGVCAGAGASGGRIAIYYDQNGDGLGGGNPFDFTSSSHVQAFGGVGDWSGETLRGGAGTIYIEQNAVDGVQEGSLYIDNNTHSNSSAGLTVGIYTFKEIKLTRAGNLTILGNSSVLNIADSNSITGDSTKPNLTIEGTVNTPNTLNISGLTLSIKGEFNLGEDNNTSSIVVGGTYAGGLTLYANTWANSTGVYNFGDVNVLANGTITLPGYNNGDSNWTNDNGVNIHANNFIVQTGGYINGDYLGYGQNIGPGTGNGSSYGGIGAGSSIAYGSVYEPTDLGSGGYHFGGGAIKLTINNLLQIDGTISVNGEGPNGCHQGGGTGGSIYLDTNILKGLGLLRSNGANGSCSGNGGAGGRIAVYFDQNGDGLGGDNTFAITDRSHIQAFGGPADWCGVACNAGAGTVYVEHKGVDTNHQGALYIDNANSVAQAAALISGSYTFKEINLTRYGNLNVLGDGSSLTITNGNQLTGDSTKPNLNVYGTFNAPSNLTITGVNLGINGAINLGGDNSTSHLTIGGSGIGSVTLNPRTWSITDGVYNLGDITVSNNGVLNLNSYDSGDTNWTNDFGVDLHLNNLYVEAGGYVNADKLGYGSARGPGGLGNGASYGGIGYSSTTRSYGSITRPISLGSGANVANGGGVINLTVNDSVINYGTISSNGGYGVSGCQAGSSGGSIFIDANAVGGTGVIRADGGNSNCYGSGGGGRIAILFNENGIGEAEPLDFNNISLIHTLGGLGGCGVNCNGGPGTLYSENKALFASGNGDLVIDNNGTIGENGMDFLPQDYNFNDVRIGANVKVLIKGDLNTTSEGHAYPANIVPGDAVSGLTALGLWHLDELYGTGNYLTDASGNGRNLSISGGTNTTGFLGNAKNLNLNGNGLSVPSPIILPSNWSISTWLKFPLPTSLDGWRTVTSHLGGGQHQIIIDVSGNLGSYNSAWYPSGYNTSGLSTGWHNIVASENAGTTSFFVDGNLVGSIATNAGTDISSLCNYAAAGQQQCGAMDETAIFGRALSGSEIATLFSYYQSHQADFNSQYNDAIANVVGRGVVFNLTGGFTLSAGAILDGKLQGFSSSTGAGAGGTGLGLSGGGGGGYGGAGGSGQSDGSNPSPLGGSSYGSQRTPLNLGSGGGASGVGTVGGFGGGAIAIRARYGDVNLASGSSIDMSGETGHISSPGGGGGAGGSILIEGATCNLDGTLNASGGNGGNSTFDGGGGGGGRVSILYSVGPCDLGGTLNVAEGSSVQAQSGQVGTSPAVTSIPAVPTIKQQFESDASTIIPAGGSTTQDEVVLKANVSDPGATVMSPKHLRAEFEIVPFTDEFTASSLSNDFGDLTGASIEYTDLTYTGGAPVIAQVPVNGLVKGESYKWRTRIVNTDDSIASDWINFSNSSSVAAFRVSSVNSVEASVNPTTVTAGEPITITVTAKDSFGNPDSSYTGTIHFSSNSPSAILPADYQFSGSDNGVHVFTDGIIFIEDGSFTITITDTSNGSLTYTTSSPITVNPADVPEDPGTPVSTPVLTPDDYCTTNPTALTCLADVQISNVEFKKINETTVEICWTTNVPSKGSVDYGLASNGIYTDSTPVEDSYSTSHCITIDNLEAGQTYIFRVNSVAESSKSSRSVYAYSLEKGETVGVVETTDFISLEERPYAFNSNGQALLKYLTIEDATCKVDYGLEANDLPFSSEFSDGTNHSSVIDLNNADGVRDIYFKVICSSNITNETYNVTGIIPVSQYKPYLLVAADSTTQDISQIFANIFSPTLLTLSFGLLLLLNLLVYPRLILFFLALLRDPVRLAPWGIVHDVVTKTPIPFATVRIYSVNGNIKTFIKEKITNLNGKYGLPVNKGVYAIEVLHPEYETYKTEITLDKEQNIAKDIGLQPKGSKVIEKKSGAKAIIQKSLRKINTIIVVSGFVISIISVIISATLLNIVLLGIYIIQFGAFYFLGKNPRNWGYLFDSKGKQRVKGGFIRVYSIKEGRQLDVQMSDESGRFGFDLEEGTYGVAANVPGFQFPSTSASGAYIKNKDGSEYIQISIQKGEALNEGIPLDKSNESENPIEGFGS